MVDTHSDPLALLTMQELCQLLKVSRYQVYDEIKAGRLPALRLGVCGRQWRFRRRDVEAYLVESQPCRTDEQTESKDQTTTP